MPHFRKRPVVVEAHRWWANGDHPHDYTRDLFNGDGSVWPAEDRREVRAEGDVVRRYRPPDGIPEAPEFAAHGDHPDSRRPGCRYPMGSHGWIDTIEGGHTVCPGDWIITGVQGERYPCEAGIFEATYEPCPAPPLITCEPSAPCGPCSEAPRPAQPLEQEQTR